MAATSLKKMILRYPLPAVANDEHKTGKPKTKIFLT